MILSGILLCSKFPGKIVIKLLNITKYKIFKHPKYYIVKEQKNHGNYYQISLNILSNKIANTTISKLTLHQKFS